MRLSHDRARVRVPATSANLGPGFDAFGLALSIWDDVEVEAITGPTQVEVEGQGAGSLPTGDDHLIIRALRAALDHVNAPQAGFFLRCRNRIPHGRGLGSSAAATVAGLMLARALISTPEALDYETLLALATEFEGHPDNAAPALYGGATIAFHNHGKPAVAHIPLCELDTTVLLPTHELATSQSRGALPDAVSHVDAAFNAGRAGLLALALSGQHDLLMAATQDRLHQPYRSVVMPHTASLIEKLRDNGVAAVVSGAGPSILVLGDMPTHASGIIPNGWEHLKCGIAPEGAHIVKDLR